MLKFCINLLLHRLKPQSAKGALSIQLLWATARLLVTRFGHIYLVGSFFNLFLVSWTKWEHWVNLRFYVYVFRVDQGNEKGTWVKISLTAREVTWFSLCEVFMMIKLMVIGFYSIGGWCYSGWWVWNLSISSINGNIICKECH